MKYQERVSTREDVKKLYQRVLQDSCIEQYRGYTSCNSYGWDELANDYIKKCGEGCFNNPAYVPPKGEWKESLKGLIETPAIVGIDVVVSPIEQSAKELVGGYESYLRQQIQVHCDPDVLEQTAQKNKKLMDLLAQIDKEIESGELIRVRHGFWITHDDEVCGSYYTCSACKCDWCTIDGTPEENIMRYCPECGAKMDLEKTEKGG